jgi:hypothetical protein
LTELEPVYLVSFPPKLCTCKLPDALLLFIPPIPANLSKLGINVNSPLPALAPPELEPESDPRDLVRYNVGLRFSAKEEGSGLGVRVLVHVDVLEADEGRENENENGLVLFANPGVIGVLEEYVDG